MIQKIDSDEALVLKIINLLELNFKWSVIKYLLDLLITYYFHII
jgi:hypothetical protein